MGQKVNPISNRLGIIKGWDSNWIGDKKRSKNYGDTILKKYYWKPLFWSDSYFVATVSENSLTMVKEYIKNQ